MNLEERKTKIKEATKVILEAMGYDLNSPNFLDTPRRFAEAMLSFKADNTEEPKMTTFKVEDTVENLSIVTAKSLEVRSLCGHHLFPFIGECSVMYMPREKTLGLSKFQRALDFVANKATDQETITNELRDYIVKKTDPHFVIVYMRCKHTCMSARGVKCHNAETETYSRYTKDSMPEEVYQNYLKLLKN